jgi:hypothetical protein
MFYFSTETETCCTLQLDTQHAVFFTPNRSPQIGHTHLGPENSRPPDDSLPKPYTPATHHFSNPCAHTLCPTPSIAYPLSDTLCLTLCPTPSVPHPLSSATATGIPDHVEFQILWCSGQGMECATFWVYGETQGLH